MMSQHDVPLLFTLVAVGLFGAVYQGLYPLLVADVAEKNWDYSRPRWVHRLFGI